LSTSKLPQAPSSLVPPFTRPFPSFFCNTKGPLPCFCRFINTELLLTTHRPPNNFSFPVFPLLHSPPPLCCFRLLFSPRSWPTFLTSGGLVFCFLLRPFAGASLLLNNAPSVNRRFFSFSAEWDPFLILSLPETPAPPSNTFSLLCCTIRLGRDVSFPNRRFPLPQPICFPTLPESGPPVPRIIWNPGFHSGDPGVFCCVLFLLPVSLFRFFVLGVLG